MANQEQAPDPRWHDPESGWQGVLLSDAIEYYIEKVQLLEDWDKASLKPASYGLRLGSRYYANGEFGDLKPGEKLKIPKNSIVYVSMLEKVNMPLYMIGRFNLKIDLIYQGIILGTGPQVDPGFRGRLSCPLHNISNNDVELQHGDRFATIDFVKTTRFAPSVPVSGMSLKELYEKYAEGGVPGQGGRPLKLFPSDKLERKQLDNYLPSGRMFKSSLADIENRLSGITKMNVAVVIAAFAILVSFVVGGATIAWNQFQYYSRLRDHLDEQLRRNANLSDGRDALSMQQRSLDERMNRLEAEIARLAGKTRGQPIK